MPAPGGAAIRIFKMSRQENFFLRHRLFILLLIAIAALRLAVLLTSQYALNSDEAVIGLMARQIVELGDYPIFFYGPIAPITFERR